MSLKSRINKLYALKSMLIQAREQAKMKNILNSELELLDELEDDI